MTAASVWHARFTDAQGLPTPLSAVVTKRAALVTFWASWCVPCRDELARLAVRQGRFVDLDVVAISIDEDPAWPTASGILADVSWPYASLRDPAGAIFYQTQASGQLPLTLLFSHEGQLMERLEVVDDAVLDRLESIGKRPVAASSGPWTISNTSTVRTQRSATGSRAAAAAANTVGVTWHKSEWTAALSHDALRQRRDRADDDSHDWNEGWTRPEDEVGFSYVEWRAPNPMLRARLGDESIAILSGALVDAARRPETNSAASVMGAHFGIDRKGYSASVLAGTVRDRIYPYELDARHDLSVKRPRERVAAAFTRITGSTAVYGGLGVAAFEKARDVSVGVPETYRDRRYGAHLGVGDSVRGATAQFVRYLPEANADTGELPPHVGSLAAQAPIGGPFRLTANAQRTWHLPPRASLSELTEFPFQPLASDTRFAARLTPTLALGNAGIAKVAVVRDLALELDGYAVVDRQSTVLARWTRKDVDAVVGQQRGTTATLRQRHTEGAVSVGGELTHGLHGLVMMQRHDTAPLESGRLAEDGRRTKLRLDAAVPTLTRWSTDMRFTTAASHVRQSGHYVNVSEIDARAMSSGEIGLATGGIQLSLAVGREPGGLVCTGGSCSVRAPLDGVALSVDIERAL